MTIQGKKVDMNKLKDPFKLRDAARDAGISLPDQLPDGLEAAFDYIEATLAPATAATEAEGALWACRELGISLRSHEAISRYRWPHQTAKRLRSVVPAYEGALVEALENRIGRTATLEEVRLWLRAQARVELHDDNRQLSNWLADRRKALRDFRPPWCDGCDDHLQDTSRPCGNCFGHAFAG